MQTAVIFKDIKPFLKWPGGKRQLLSQITSLLPSKIRQYHEPFLGGGAIMFHILTQRTNIPVRVSDVNSDLINCYLVVKENLDKLIDQLKIHQKNYMKNRDKYYYKIRDEFESDNKIQAASRFIFLNKTCFNGLYRLNRKGKFNVPLGAYTNPNIVNEENLRMVSDLFNRNNISMNTSDFENSLKHVKNNDFVFLDPPYAPSCKSTHSTHYWSKPFDHAEQERLKLELDRLDKKGAKFLLTNSDTNETRKIYKDYMSNSIKINGVSVISCLASSRSGHKQLIIKNY